MSGALPEHFGDRVAVAVDRVGAPACVGLDPVLERLPRAVREGADPVDAVAAFCEGVLGAVKGVVPVVKFQSACFERYGAAGMAALVEGIARARESGFVVILDAKRGDIGVTAEHYAAAVFDGCNADAVTISGYLGEDTVRPFMRAGRGVFVLVRTSNPGSDGVQRALMADGRSVSEMVADMVRGLGRDRVGSSGLSEVGAVVGATKAGEGARLRERMGEQIFLVPGYGAQGGTLDDVRTMVRPGGSRGQSGVLVTASRSVIYSFDDSAGKDWRVAVRKAAERLRDELSGL